MSDLKNLEALMHICANCTEIIGVAAGTTLLVASWIPYASGLRGYTKKILVGSIIILVVALLAPEITKVPLSESDVGVSCTLPVTIIILLAMLPAFFVAYFVPSIIAFREKKKNKFAILIFNIFAFIPFVWLISIIWACVPEKREIA